VVENGVETKPQEKVVIVMLRGEGIALRSIRINDASSGNQGKFEIIFEGKLRLLN
jgi:hypothetical protein